MEALQGIGWYYPEGAGGTEAYVASLSARLLERGVHVRIAAPRDGTAEDAYQHAGVPVYRYPVGVARSTAQLAGEAPHDGFDRFLTWLDARREARVWHQHSFTYGCGVHHLEAARRRGLATVLTVHVPQPVCIRGTMLHEGREPCDGIIREGRCAACWLQQRGLPQPWRAAVAALPVRVGARLRHLGRFGTALAASQGVSAHRERLLRAVASADVVVAVSEWLREALLANGVPPGKLVLQRQGVDPAPRRSRETSDGPLTIGFLGRAHPVKGLDVLVRAVKGLPAGIPVRLLVHATASDPEGEACLKEAQALAQGDTRIAFLGPLPREDVPGFVSTLDVLAVPSQWMETGPIVVLEALAAGTPVVGSAFGGIPEWIEDGVNGLLVPHADVPAWTRAFERIARDRGLLQRLAAAIEPVRSASDVAVDVLATYRAVLEHRSAA